MHRGNCRRAKATGFRDGSGEQALFNTPMGIAWDGIGNLVIADSLNDTIRLLSSSGLVSTLAGRSGVEGNTDDMGSLARFNKPQGVAVDANGAIYVADSFNCSIRKIDPSGSVHSIAGVSGWSANVPNGKPLLLSEPWSLCVEPNSGTLFVTVSDSVLRLVPR